MTIAIAYEDLLGLRNAETHLLGTLQFGQAKALSPEDPLTPLKYFCLSADAWTGWFRTREAIGKRLGIDENLRAEAMPEPVSIEFLRLAIEENYRAYVKPIIDSGCSIDGDYPDYDESIKQDTFFTGPESVSTLFGKIKKIMDDPLDDKSLLSEHVQDWWKNGEEMRAFHQDSDKNCQKDGKTCGGVAAGCPVAGIRR
jgi:hypothetical protein